MTSTEALDLAEEIRGAGRALTPVEQALIVLADSYYEMSDEIAVEHGHGPARLNGAEQ